VIEYEKHGKRFDPQYLERWRVISSTLMHLNTSIDFARNAQGSQAAHAS
jgi:hypothetical protein